MYNEGLTDSVEDEISPAYVQARIDDWTQRIRALYQDVKDWLRPIDTLAVTECDNVMMYEELMQKAGLPPRALPALDIHQDDETIARLKPIGLWIVGANGRVDILLRRGAIILTDASERFQPPNWVVHEQPYTSQGRRLSREYFLELLGIHQHASV